MKNLFKDTQNEYTKNLKFLLTEKDVENLIENYNYIIGNFSLVTYIKGNRGIKGFELSRVKYYLNKMENGMFDFQLASVKMTKNCVVVEGCSKVEAGKMFGVPIKVEIVGERTIEQIAYFNTHKNSKWSICQQLESAIAVGYEGAIMFDEVIAEFRNKYKFSDKEISPTEVYAVVMKNAAICGSGKYPITVGMYNDPKLIEMIEHKDSYHNLDLYFSVRSKLKLIETRNRVSQYALELHLNGEIDLGMFLEGLNLTNFRFEITNKGKQSWKKEVIQNEIKRITRKGLRYSSAKKS